MDFEWDEAKAEANEAKHGVTFEEAATVFSDDYARVIDNPDHSDKEDRFIILGLSLRARELVVVHCYRQDEGAIRLISAREATKKETSEYWRFRHAR